MESKLFKLSMVRITSKVIMGQLVVDHEKSNLLVESTVYEDVGRNACDLPLAGQIQASWTKRETPFTAEKCVSDTEAVVCVVSAVVPWEDFKSAREETRKRKYREDTGEEWPEARPATPMGEARPKSPVYLPGGA